MSWEKECIKDLRNKIADAESQIESMAARIEFLEKENRTLKAKIHIFERESTIQIEEEKENLK